MLVSLGCYDKYHRLGGLNNKQLFLTVLESGKSRIKVLANVVSGEKLLPSLQTMATLLLYPHMVERDHLSHLSSSKSTNPIYKGSTLMT